MNYNLSYHHVDHSNAFDSFVAQKVEHMHKLLNRVGSLEFVADKNGRDFSFSAHLKANKKEFYFKSNAENIYEAAAKVMARMRNGIKA